MPDKRASGQLVQGVAASGPVWQVCVDPDAPPVDPRDLDDAVAELLLSMMPGDVVAAGDAAGAAEAGWNGKEVGRNGRRK
jgi:hypothetical protein